MNLSTPRKDMSSPRKLVPLAPAAELTASRSEISVIAEVVRAFFCGVVVESAGHEGLTQDIQELVASLGSHIDPNALGRSTSTPSISSSSSLPFPPPPARSSTDVSSLADVINELVSTERSYVKRLRILQQNYAIPLRSFARQKDTALLPAYEANTLFGNIDQVLMANEAFLADLEKMMTPQGPRIVGGIGDIALRHFRDLETFHCYRQYYSKREEAQAIFEREMAKRSATGFAAYIDRIKYSAHDSKNRVGLRELLMDPVQRIPRYTLLFRSMIKYMSPADPQRAKLVEADGCASRIAQCETDEQTWRAAVMYCLERSVEGFPPGLISNGRRFIDCIDVEDIPADTHPANVAAASTSTAPPTVLHCTMFLFDDRLVIVKRPSPNSSGRVLAGLDELEKLTKAGGLPLGMKRSGMTCKGVVEITDVTMGDMGGGELHLYLNSPPTDQSTASDRWSNRPFRALSVVLNGSPIHLNPQGAIAEKDRFLNNLWKAQALYRTRNGRSVPLVAKDLEVEFIKNKSKREIARSYFNVYQRTGWLGEPRKTAVLLHIDPSGRADPLPFGMSPDHGGGPHLIIRVQPMPGELSRYTVTSRGDDIEDTEDIVHSRLVASRVIKTIHQYGLFDSRGGYHSTPNTPLGGSRPKGTIFGLDTISRNLFGGIPVAKEGTFGSMVGQMRSRSRATSTSNSTATGTDSSYRFSTRSISTGVTSQSDEDTFSKPTGKVPPPREDTMSPVRKLIKRGKSPGLESGGESRGASRSPSKERAGSGSRPPSRAGEEESSFAFSKDPMQQMDQSEWDLTMRLELAHRNGKNQSITEPAAGDASEEPIEETIYEEAPPSRFPSRLDVNVDDMEYDEDDWPPTRPASPWGGNQPGSSSLLRDGRSPSPFPFKDNRPPSPFPFKQTRPSSPVKDARPPSPAKDLQHPPSTNYNRTPSPADTFRPVTPSGGSRPSSPTSIGSRSTRSTRKPRGPRRSSIARPTSNIDTLEAMEIELALDEIASGTAVDPSTPPQHHSSGAPTPQPQRASRRRPFEPTGNETTPRNAGGVRSPGSIEPLSIRKKSSVKSTPPGSMKRSPLYGRSMGRTTSGSRRTSSQKMLERKLNAAKAAMAAASGGKGGASERLVSIAESTREDLDSARRVVKKIKLEVETLRLYPSVAGSSAAAARPTGIPNPINSAALPRSPQSRHISNKAVESRMQEMREMIERRAAEGNSFAPRRMTVSESTAPPKRCATAPGPSAAPAAAAGVEVDTGYLGQWTKNVEELVAESDRTLSRAIASSELVHTDVLMLAAEMREKLAELERSRTELASSKRQCELVKKLLSDAAAENEILFQAFNEELDGMFNDANLPETEAWSAMTHDLQTTKETRNELSQENVQLKQKLQQLELQNEEWGSLLRTHGLIS